MRIRKRRTKIRARFSRPVVRKLRALGRANRFWGWSEVDATLNGSSSSTKAGRLDFQIYNPDTASRGRIHNLSVDWQGTNFLESGTTVEEPAVVGIGIFRITGLRVGEVDSRSDRFNALQKSVYFPGLFTPNRAQRGGGTWVTRRELYFPTSPKVFNAQRPDPALHVKLRVNNALIMPGTLFGVFSWLVDDRGNANHRVGYQTVCRMTTSNDQDSVNFATCPKFEDTLTSAINYTTTSKAVMNEIS